MKDWTRRVLEIAAGPPDPAEMERLQASLPGILARARRARESKPRPTTWDLLLPLTRRWLPAAVATAASLVLLALLWAGPATADPWETSLLAQAAGEAPAGDIVAEAIAEEEAP
jgi:hypothetical protein